jgi:transposase
LRTSGRTKREIGEDLGVSLSTLTRWLSQRRDREMDEPDRRSEGEDAAAELKRLRRDREMDEPDRRSEGEDAAAELKRLRRENEILRHERDILKRATAFFAREGSR